MQYIKRYTLLLAALLYLMPMWAHRAVDTFVADRSTDPDNVAVMVIDLSNGRTIASHNIDKPLVPASVTKAVTIASLLRKTGIDYVYSTRVFAVGDIRGGTLAGNIVIKASGDPSLNSDREPFTDDFVQQCVDAMRGYGIKCITGDISIDQSVFSGPDTPDSWLAADRSSYYGTASHGFNFERNASGKSSVANPAEVFLKKLYAAAANAGITIERGKVDLSIPTTMILQHDSAPIDEIMRSCMMRSDNLYAETLLRTLSLETDGKGDTRNGANYEAEYWKKQKAPMGNVTLVDGSGLSRQNRMTANFLANVLKLMSEDVDYVSFFPLAGQEGTLRNFLKDTPLDSYIAMKTGSMNGVQCYVGYKLDEDYAPTHVVVIMMNNFSNRDAIKKAAARMLLEIFDCESES